MKKHALSLDKQRSTETIKSRRDLTVGPSWSGPAPRSAIKVPGCMAVVSTKAPSRRQQASPSRPPPCCLWCAELLPPSLLVSAVPPGGLHLSDAATRATSTQDNPKHTTRHATRDTRDERRETRNQKPEGTADQRAAGTRTSSPSPEQPHEVDKISSTKYKYTSIVYIAFGQEGEHVRACNHNKLANILRQAPT